MVRAHPNRIYPAIHRLHRHWALWAWALWALWAWALEFLSGKSNAQDVFYNRSGTDGMSEPETLRMILVHNPHHQNPHQGPLQECCHWIDRTASKAPTGPGSHTAVWYNSFLKSRQIWMIPCVLVGDFNAVFGNSITKYKNAETDLYGIAVLVKALLWFVESFVSFCVSLCEHRGPGRIRNT